MNKVKPGDPLNIPAVFFNETIDTNEIVKRNDLSGLNIRLNNFGIVIVRNDSGKDRKPFEPLTISSLLNPLVDNKAVKSNAVLSAILDDTVNLFGICLNKIDKNSSGRVMLAGITPARIKIESPTHQYAKLKGTSLVSSSSGSARILGKQTNSGETWALLYLGMTSGGNEYNGPFKVELAEDKTLKVSGGYLNRNGEFLTIDAKTGITPQAGILCLCTTIEEGKWTKPEFRIAKPAADAYPIAELSVEEVKGNTSVAIRQFAVTVAIILLTKHCPLTKE